MPGGHYVSVHEMNILCDYSEDYLNNTYGNYLALQQRFDQINRLPESESDNYGRIAYIREFCELWFGEERMPTVFDIGSGIGIFPYSAIEMGWSCVALDPDRRCVDHLIEELGVEAICGEFESNLDVGVFDLLTFNKVLEHVVDPISMLRISAEYLGQRGLVYLEVPDGESAELHGSNREEFFLEHHHIFSARSLEALICRAGFVLKSMDRVTEPSSKFSLRAICTATG